MGNKYMGKNIDDLNQLLNLILDNSFGNIFVTDNKGDIIYVNENSVQALGISKETLLKMSVYDLVEQNIVSCAASITTLETKQESIQSVKLSTGVTLAVSAKPIFDEQGEIEYVVVFSQNHIVVEHFMKSIQEENLLIRQTLGHVLQESETDSALVAESKAIRNCLSIASRAANLDSIIMLYGESGTGKEVVARFVHRNSHRKNQIFLPVNCAAIPQELMESEFFGYERGAFTGSNREGKPGLFELADGGTLFLDEIGELNLPMQSKLLRVLETGEILHVGGTKIKKINVRIVAATNRDLETMMQNGTFREDLFYRLNVIPITVPPLRERKEDTAVLVVYYMGNLNRKYFANKSFSQGAIEAFQSYPWPGNVRELKNVVERIFAVVSEDIITEQHVAEVLGLNNYVNTERPLKKKTIALENYRGTLQEATEAFQRDYISSALKKCSGNVEMAAKQLQMGRSSLYKKLDRLGMKNHPAYKKQ